MKGLRSLTSLCLLAALVLVASDASAVYYTFAGTFTSNRGKLVNIPVVGSAPCPATLTLMSGPGGMTVPATMTPTVHPVTRGANTQPSSPVPTMGAAMGMDIGCVGPVAGKLLETTGTMAKVGGAFTLPTMVWSDPLPSYLAAVAIKYAPPVIQLATSFKITGPNVSRTPQGTTMGPTNVGTMFTGMNGAAWRAFKAGAWMTQTGRDMGTMSSGKFTWCFGGPACTNITGAATGVPLIIKYAGGGAAFGGTMGYVITAGAGVSSLAIGLGGGAVGFLGLAGMGSQPTGRGYAQYLTDMLAAGPVWGAYMLGYMTGPIVGKQKLITMIYAYLGPFFPANLNYNFGFPFTTMTVLARNTGTQGGAPAITTLTAKGSDMLTSMGGRNIQLVAGSLAATTLPPAGTQTPNIAMMQLTLPEPGPTVQMLAGVIGLLGIAAWRSRKVR